MPCAVDRRGVDPTVEHDSHGQLVWGVVELFRLTGDRAFLRELWPRVRAAADAIAALRAAAHRRRLPARRCFGLLPESISHEGYASRPVHSYWDDFFAVRGPRRRRRSAAGRSATPAGARRGSARCATRCAATCTPRSRATMARHGIDFLPGSVELGDFDPTSTAIAFDPCGEARTVLRGRARAHLRALLAGVRGAPAGEAAADAYTPYEVRNVDARCSGSAGSSARSRCSTG